MVRELRSLWLCRHGLLGLGRVARSGGGTRLADLPSLCGGGQRLYRTPAMICRPRVAAAGTTTPSVVYCDAAEGMFEARANAHTMTSADAASSLDTSSSFLFSHLASSDAYRCAPPTIACLPSLRASPGTAPRRPSPPSLYPGAGACRCAPPTVAGESKNGSTRCGGGRHPLSPV
jgi:hypothetical protein